MSGAARMLGVHANTVRAWTDQGRLSCVRINDRGDRRYRDRDLRAFLEQGGLQSTPSLPFQSRLRPAPATRITALPMPGSAGRSLTIAAAAAASAAIIDERTVPPDEAGLLALVTGIAGTHLEDGDLETTLRVAVRGLRDLGRFSMVAVGRWDRDRLVAHRIEGGQRARAWWKRVDHALARVSAAEQRPIAASVGGGAVGGRWPAAGGPVAVQVFTPIGGSQQPWGALVVESAPGASVDAHHLELLAAIGSTLGLAAQAASLAQANAASEGRAALDAQELARTATWAAQLQSIQALGTRLANLASVSDIGHAICLELRDLIDYHNVRVYRVAGEDVLPVAWRGEIGEYTGEDSDQLRLQVGQGITGWVAQHGAAEYLPDAGADPRSETIPGTEDDLDESMLLAPMRHDDRVIGVIVLSKLGIDRFGQDDLRYLEIYASMAAQAVVNVEAAERLRAQSRRLETQLETQRELIRITESILSSLDPRTVLGEIAQRLGTLVPVDTIGLDLYRPDEGLLVPLYASGVDADAYLARALSDQQGVAGWVARHGEAQLVPDELVDPRVAHFDTGPEPGALIVAPLRGRDGVSGVLTLERLGTAARFEDWEFELVTLFTGHVSIALVNAVDHEAVEHRARTDALTGLKNQGTFADDLARAVARDPSFSLLIVDLDDFKGYNDTHGHEAGNRMLQLIASGIQGAARDSDSVYRYGGDEFAVLLPGTTDQGAMRVAERLGAAVAGSGPGVSCSIGVASYPADGADGAALLGAADRACYVAKRSGRAQVATAREGQELPSSVLTPPPTPFDVLQGDPGG